MTFLTYQLKVAVIMAVFYIFFRLLLIKDTWHRLNRIVLLSTALLSFLLPVCIITIHKTEVLPMPVAQLMQAVSSTPAQPSTPWWHIALLAVYAAGVVFVLARVLTSVHRVRSIIKNARKEVMADGTSVYIMPGNAASFSWMGHIVISEADWNNHETAIINHEKAHVALRHSIDVLITDIIAALQWFNPAIWMLRIDLRAVHEYEADDTVLRAGADIRSYQYLLIIKAAAMNGYTIANNFNHSILKNRIFMMEKERTTRRSLLRALYLLPLVCISLALNAQTKVTYVYKDNNADQSKKVTVAKVTVDQDSLEFSGTINYDIIKLLPGVQFDQDGNITVNGKPVSKVRVDGKVVYDNQDANTPDHTIHMNYSNNNDMSIEEFVRSVPGVEFDNEGNVTVNGKKVSKILVNGKELNLNKNEQSAPASNATKIIDEDGNLTIDTQNGIRVNLNGTQVTK